jgi:hypothetical protein
MKYRQLANECAESYFIQIYFISRNNECAVLIGVFSLLAEAVALWTYTQEVII